MKSLGRILILLLGLSTGCSFEKLNFTIDKGQLDPSSVSTNTAKAVPLIVH
jgi:hypothetical protein